MKLTDYQKRVRRYARENGAKALTAINNACWPVYTGDEEMWERMAVGYAVSAFKYARLALDVTREDA